MKKPTIKSKIKTMPIGNNKIRFKNVYNEGGFLIQKRVAGKSITFLLVSQAKGNVVMENKSFDAVKGQIAKLTA